MDSRPWDYQAEECSLRSAVDRFNHRRYQRELPNIQSQQGMDKSQEKTNNETENQVFGQEVKFNENKGAFTNNFYKIRWHSTLYNCKNFKQNCKTFQQDLRMVKEHASEIQNIFCMKS